LQVLSSANAILNCLHLRGAPRLLGLRRENSCSRQSLKCSQLCVLTIKPGKKLGVYHCFYRTRVSSDTIWSWNVECMNTTKATYLLVFVFL